MRTTIGMIFALGLATSAVAVTRPLAWTSETSRRDVQRFAALHGDALGFAVAFNDHGNPLAIDGCDVSLHWQTNGMSGFWSMPCEATGNVARVVFASALDPGAPQLRFVLGLREGSNVVYGAEAVVSFAHSPGFAPNAIPLPVQTLDFATIEVANAPWPAEIDSATNSLSASLSSQLSRVSQAATNYTDSATNGLLRTESDPTVPGWAKSATKPSYTAAEVGATLARSEGYTDWVVTAPPGALYHDLSVGWAEIDENTWSWMLLSAGSAVSPFFVSDQNATWMSVVLDVEYVATRSRLPGYQLGGDTNHILAAQNDLESLQSSVLTNAEDIAEKTLKDREFGPWKVSPDIVSGPEWMNVETWDETSPDDPNGQWAADMGFGLEFMGGTYDGTASLSWTYYSEDYDEEIGDLVVVGTPITATRSRLPGYQLGSDTNHILAAEKDMPGDYATVSNRAMTALQSYTEADPTISSWAKAQSKPTYTASEVGVNDYVTVSNKAMTALQSYTETDPTISAWAKAQSKPTYTASEVGATTAEDVYRLIAGTNVVLVVTNYNSATHAPAMKLQHLDPQSGQYVTYWDETRRHGLTLTNAMHYTDAQIETRAPRAWSGTTSGLGSEAPAGVTWISTPETVIAGGFEYEKVVTSAGAVWVLASNGLATGATTNSFFRVSASDGTELFSIEKTDSYLVGVNADGITRSGNTVTIPMNVVANEHPYIRAATNLVNAVWVKEDENGFTCPWAAVSWSGTTGAYVATVTCSQPSAFFYFEFLQEGGAKVKNSAATELAGGIIFNGTTYMPTVNGNKLEFVAQ